MTRHRQLIILYILPLVAVVLSLLIHAGFTTTLILFWGLPSLLLTIWAPRHISKAVLFSLSATIFFMALDIIFHVSGQWQSNLHSHLYIFGTVPIEDLFYWFLFFYYPILFWEHFYEKRPQERPWNKKMARLTIFFVFFFLIVAATWLWAPHLLRVPYFYLVMDILGMILLFMELLFFPRVRHKFLRIGVFFAYVALLYEVTALYLVQWNYPSTQFIGWVDLFHLKFPFEEFIGWIVLGVAIILTVYEHFDDDNR